MSIEYAESRIKEALKLSGGNATYARKQVIAWAMKDPKLLEALTKHHLTGIVAYHMERVMSGRSARAKMPPSQPPPPKKVQAQDTFGKEILRAVADSSSAVFGLEGYSGPPSRKPASQQHVNAIRQMAREIKAKHRD